MSDIEVKVSPMSEWVCRPLVEKYSLVKQIGHGSYGSVYEALRIKDGKKMALKKMDNLQQQTQQARDYLGFPITTLRQIKLLQHLTHPNILNINEIVFEKPHRMSNKSFPIVYLCLDLMDVDLNSLIVNREYEVTLYRLQTILRQIFQGLEYLHAKNIAHRDLKPSNILINSKGEVKIADFGLAKKLSKFSTTTVVSLWYRAPELLLKMRTYSTNIDIWSVGCILAEFLLRKPLFFKSYTQLELINEIYSLVGTPDMCEWPEAQNLQNYESMKPEESKQNEVILYIKKKAPLYSSDNILLDLLQKMLRLNPQSRYSASQCLNHEFFKLEYPKEEEILPLFIIEEKQKLYEGQEHVHKKPKID